MKRIRILILVAVACLTLSFQCRKAYVDQEVVLIEGRLVDVNGNPLPDFTFFLTHREIESEEFLPKTSDERIAKTNQLGAFKLLTPKFAPMRFSVPVIAFVDTTYYTYYDVLGTQVKRPFLALLLDYSAGNTYNFGEVTIFQ
jgi:hypothetical protein